MPAIVATPASRFARVGSGDSNNFCSRCGSLMMRRFLIGAKRCVQPKCMARAPSIFDIWTGGL